MKISVIFISLVLFFGGILYAEGPGIDLSLERQEIAPGKQTRLYLKVRGAPVSKAPEIPFVEGLDIKYQGSSPDGEQTALFNYRIIAKKAGVYRVGPVYLNYEKGRLMSNSVVLSVSKDAYSAPVTATPSTDKGDISDRIYLKLELPKSKIYVNEKIPVEIKLYSDWFDLEDIMLNEIATGELLAERFSKAGSTVTNIRDTRYAILAYKTNIFAPTPGEFKIDPVKATFNIAPRRPSATGELPPLLKKSWACWGS